MNAQLWGDFLLLNFTLLRVLLLGAGLRLMVPALRGLPLVTATAVSCVLALGITITVAFAVPGPLPVLAAIVACLQAVGVYALWQERAGLKALLARPRLWGALFLGLAAQLFWVTLFRDLIALPSADDGVAHATFFVNILRTGDPLLYRIPFLYGDSFGTESFLFYPAGSHTLVALFEYWWWRAEWLAPATILRSWMLMICSGGPLLVVWGLSRLIPQIVPVVFTGLVFASLAIYQFPYWSAETGGFSRAAAHLLALPLVLALLERGTGAFLTGRLRPLFLVFAFAALFYGHPTAFGLFAFSLAFVALGDLWALWRGGERWGREALALGLPVAAGIALTLALLADGGAFSAIQLGNQSHRFMDFSWEALRQRWFGDFLSDLVWDYGDASHYALSVIEGLMLLGMAALVLPRLLPVPPRLRGYPYWMIAKGLLVMAAVFIPSRLFNLVGELYYNHPSRLAETYYLVRMLLVAAGLLTLQWGVQQILARSGRRWVPRALAVGLAAACAVIFTTDVREVIKYNRWFTQRFMKVYRSPRRDQWADVARYLREHTEKEAILVYEPRIADILPAVSFRRGLFMYLECPHPDHKSLPCQRRMDAFQEALRTLAGGGDGKSPCTASLRALKGPMYMIIDPEKAAGAASCPDVEMLQRFRDVAVYRLTSQGA